MITPDNAPDLVQLCRKQQVAAQPMFWELCAARSRLICQAYVREVELLFPVDARDGWDLGNVLHLNLLQYVYD